MKRQFYFYFNKLNIFTYLDELIYTSLNFSRLDEFIQLSLYCTVDDKLKFSNFVIFSEPCILNTNMPKTEVKYENLRRKIIYSLP